MMMTYGAGILLSAIGADFFNILSRFLFGSGSVLLTGVLAHREQLFRYGMQTLQL
jgi:hypothetical protein